MKTEIQIERLNLSGNGVGFIKSPGTLEGLRASVPFTVPGDLVEIEAVPGRAGMVRSQLLTIIRPSESRVVPRCQYFQRCGGCQFQHIQIAKQRELKLSMVTETLARFGLVPKQGFELIGAQIGAWEYRTRVDLHLDLNGNFGFFYPHSGKVIDIDRCPISRAAVNFALGELRNWKEKLAPFVFEITVEEHGQQTDVVLKLRRDRPNARDHRLPSIPRTLVHALRKLFPRLSVTFNDSPIPFGAVSAETEAHPAGHFSQANPEANQVLIETLLRLVSHKQVTEFHAGAGNFTIPLTEAGYTVEAIELDSELVKFGNTRLAKLPKIHSSRFVNLSAERFAEKGNFQATVILDPPRDGAPKLVQHLTPKSIHEILYVSCGLKALTYDLATLTQNGFAIHSVKALDMFPQTHHVECLVKLVAA